MKGWNLLFLHAGDWQDDSTQSAEWNRGAFLVEGPGHCGGCHTPKNLLGAGKSGQELHGGDLDNWVAPDLTGNERTGLGRWSVDEIAEFLKTGRNVHANAGGAMAEVVTYSTSLLSDGDRHAIAVYLKSRAGKLEGRADDGTRTGPHATGCRDLFRRVLGVPPRERRRASQVPFRRSARMRCCSRTTPPVLST